jgi:hypothetical protein
LTKFKSSILQKEIEMAKRSLMVTTRTPTATADTTALLDATHHGIIQGGTSSQKIAISEVTLAGQASASAPTFMMLSRDTVVGGTVTKNAAITDEPLDAATIALANPPVTGDTHSTDPQRSVTGHLLNLSFNAFGGFVRWLAPPGGEIYIVGNTQPLGEVSLSAYTGGSTGLVGSHIIYEPF